MRGETVAEVDFLGRYVVCLPLFTFFAIPCAYHRALEQCWSKDQILETYLNLVPFRGGHGVLPCTM